MDEELRKEVIKNFQYFHGLYFINHGMYRTSFLISYSPLNGWSCLGQKIEPPKTFDQVKGLYYGLTGSHLI